MRENLDSMEGWNPTQPKQTDGIWDKIQTKPRLWCSDEKKQKQSKRTLHLTDASGSICRLQVAGCRLQVAGRRLQVAGCRLQFRIWRTRERSTLKWKHTNSLILKRAIFKRRQSYNSVSGRMLCNICPSGGVTWGEFGCRWAAKAFKPWPCLRQNPFIFATLLRVFFVTVLDCSPNALFKGIFSF